MVVTKIVYNNLKSLVKVNRYDLALCSVVLDDCLMLSDIKLCSKDGKYYLILPSKQDIYRDIELLNGQTVKMPENHLKYRDSKNEQYEEFFHPVSRNFYSLLLCSILEGYSKYKENGNRVYYPNAMKETILNEA